MALLRLEFVWGRQLFLPADSPDDTRAHGHDAGVVVRSQSVGTLDKFSLRGILGGSASRKPDPVVALVLADLALSIGEDRLDEEPKLNEASTCKENEP